MVVEMATLLLNMRASQLAKACMALLQEFHAT
jgi:hypothetical protein